MENVDGEGESVPHHSQLQITDSNLEKWNEMKQLVVESGSNCKSKYCT